MAEKPQIIVPGNLKGAVPNNIVTDTSYVYDDPWELTQREINEIFKDRIDVIQELAEISIEGGIKRNPLPHWPQHSTLGETSRWPGHKEEGF